MIKNNLKSFICIVNELSSILNKKQKIRAAFVLLSIVVSSFLELLGVTAIFPFIQAVLSPEELVKNRYISALCNALGINTSNDILMMMGVLIILVYIIKNAYMVMYYYWQSDFATKIQEELSISMLNSYMKQPYEFFLDINSSDIIRGCNGDTGGVYQIISSIFTIISEGVAIVMIAICIVCLDWKIATGVFVLLMLVVILIVYVVKPVMKRAGEKAIEASTAMSKSLFQIVQGIKDIFVMQRKEFFVNEYEQAASIYQRTQRTSAFLGMCPERIIEGICVSGLVGIVCIRLVLEVDMTSFIPKLATFAMASFKILPSIGKVTSRINNIVYYRPTLNNVHNNMKLASTSGLNNRIVCNSNDIRKEIRPEFKDRITMKGVAWKYKNQEQTIFENLEIEIKKGDTVAIVGESGAGKTTVIDILLGLLKPQSGGIFMDGTDIFTIRREWASIVGYVPQEIFLIDDTIRNNIGFGISKERINDDLVWEALERAQLKKMIEELPNKLDTIVGERGMRLSGGQRQRLSIARALYKKPDILILDEATAALDNKTESYVMESIEGLKGMITMIIVAHRLTTIRNCDKIYEIKDGIAIERNQEDILG